MKMLTHILYSYSTFFQFPLHNLLKDYAKSSYRGQDPGFSFLGGGRGGGGNRLCTRTHFTSAEETKSLSAGVQGPRNSPGSFRVLDALSCYQSRIFKLSNTKWDTKT